MTTRKPRGGKGKAPARAAPKPVFDRRLMDQQLAAVGRLLAEQEFDSIEEANAYLQQALVGGELVAPGPTTPLEEAQELVYEALENSGKRRLELAREALTISPDCADASVLLAEATANPREARHLYEQGVQAGERALGPEAFAEAAGHFWGLVETRPYMRARLGLAQVLWYQGERLEAIDHLQAMLTLNPGDNQGIRYVLAGWLVAMNQDTALEELLAQYPDEWSASWAYTSALHSFRRNGPGKAADTALKEALQVNPHVPLYLLGIDPLPKDLPGYYSPGDQNEAVTYLAEGAEGWLKTPGAVEWLGQSMVRLATSAAKSRRRRT
jgi:tetratricopeptide (TPR) repeat protein